MLRDTMIFDEQLTPQKREGQSDVRRRRRLCARGDNVIVEKIEKWNLLEKAFTLIVHIKVIINSH